VAEVEPGQMTEHDHVVVRGDWTTPATLGLSIAEGKAVCMANSKMLRKLAIRRCRSRVRSGGVTRFSNPTQVALAAWLLESYAGEPEIIEPRTLSIEDSLRTLP
jgi:hypothetical protein